MDRWCLEVILCFLKCLFYFRGLLTNKDLYNYDYNYNLKTTINLQMDGLFDSKNYKGEYLYNIEICYTHRRKCLIIQH